MEVRSWVVGVPINKIIRLMEVFGCLWRHPRSWQWWYEKLTAIYNIQQYLFNPWNIFWEYVVHISFDNIWGISYDFENWLGMFLFRNIWGTFLLWWKACIWARLIFSLLIIRLDIVSLRYGHYVHLLLTRYLQIIFPFSPPTDIKKGQCLYLRRTFSLKPRFILGSVFTWQLSVQCMVPVIGRRIKNEYKDKETNTNLN